MNRRLVLAGILGAGMLGYGGALGRGMLLPCGRAAAGDLAQLDGITRIGRRLLASGYRAPVARPETLAAGLEAAARADFAANRTLRVDGWVIAQAEADLAAAIARDLG